MITQQQRDIRNAIIKHAEKHNPNMDVHTEWMINVLGSIIEGVPVMQAMGAPGDWGYDTPIGDALLALLQSPAPVEA